MNILIYNNFDCHYEMFGYIIDFCKSNHFNLDIITNTDKNMGIIDFYQTQFQNYFRLNPAITVINNHVDTYKYGSIINNENNKPYDICFLTTDDDVDSKYFGSIITNKDHYCHTQFICIDHFYSLRNLYISYENHIAIRHFKQRNVPYVYPCYELISYEDKIQCLNTPTINICIIGNHYYIDNIFEDYDKLLSLNGKKTIYHIGRCLDNFSVKNTKYDGLINTIFNCDFNILHSVLKKTHYIYIANKSTQLSYNTSGSVQLAFNYCCQLIFPKIGYKEEYQLTSPIEYHNNMDLTFHKKALYEVSQERDRLISQRNTTFMNVIHSTPNIVNKPCIKNVIPKRIFQTWESKSLTCCLKTLTQSVQCNNPDYEYHFYDNNNRRYFIQKYFDNNVLTAYDRIIPGGFKADLWRYCVLYQYGGIYCDIDMVCMNTFDSLLDNHIEFFAPIDLNNNPQDGGKHNLVNAFIGTIPKHPIMKICIDMVVDNVLNNTWTKGSKYPLEFSGPGLLGNAVNTFLKRDIRNPFLIQENPILYDKKILLLKFVHDDNRTDDDIHPTKEFIKSEDDVYFFQNRNGNRFIQKQYNSDIQVYNIKNWIEYNANNLPYTVPDKTNT